MSSKFKCDFFFKPHLIYLMLYCWLILGSLTYTQISFLPHIDCVLNEYSKLVFY